MREQVREAPPARDGWRRGIERFIGPNGRRASVQMMTTLALLVAAMWATHAMLAVSWLLGFVLVLPIAGLLVRTFIFMHDCAHGSFFASRRANEVVGFVTGVLTLTPFAEWRRAHAIHHASSGDLDRRGHGDVPTLTVREYLARSPRDRLKYRIIRHPLSLMLVGPVHLAANQRWPDKETPFWSSRARGVWMANVVIAAGVTIGFLTVGWQTVLFAYLLPFYFAAMAGVWLFYVQHQFEDAYWTHHGEWDYLDAAIRGSSHLRLSPVMRWFTGSIGLHHVHHASPLIPNYRLQECHDANELFHDSPIVTLRSGLASLSLSLWDETSGRLVRFRDVAA